jgi:hypothetical protein
MPNILYAIGWFITLLCGITLGLAIANRLPRARCWHHDISTGKSWVDGRLIDLGRRKMFRCARCDKTEIV